MGSSERRQRQKADLKAHILAAARRIVVQEGYAALTMRKLAQAVEYAPATIYLYFQDRDDIARQLAVLGLAELQAHLQKEMTQRDPARRLLQFSRAYVGFALDQPDTYRLVFMDNPRFARGGMEDDGGPGRQALAELAATI